MKFKTIILLTAIIVFSAQLIGAQTGWTTIRKGGAEDLVSVYFTSADKGWIGGDKGYLAITTDGGKTWSRQTLTTENDVNEIYFRNDNNGYVLAGRNFFVSDDGGKSWRENRILSLNEFKGVYPEFLSIRFTDKKRGWIVGSVSNQKGDVVDSLVLQTTDGGENWARVKVPTKAELYHLDFIGTDRGWIVGDAGNILTTSDGGATWTKQTSGTDKSLQNVDFRNANDGFIVGAKGTILRTENGGATWQKIGVNSTDYLLRVNFYDDKNGFIVGRKGVILRSEDRGRTWVKQESGTIEPLFGLYIEKKYGWAVGGKGTVLKYQR